MDFNNEKAVEVYSKKSELYYPEQQIFQKYLSDKTLDILDIGCGTGRTTYPLWSMGHKVTGVDIAPMMVLKAKAMYPDIRFMVMNAQELLFDSSSFDCVLFSFNGLDYIYPLENRIQTLNEIKRVLVKKGLLIYSSHENKFNWRSFRRIKKYDPPYRLEKTVYGELITFYGSLNENREQLSRTGFELIEAYPTFGKMWRYYVCRSAREANKRKEVK